MNRIKFIKFTKFFNDLYYSLSVYLYLINKLIYNFFQIWIRNWWIIKIKKFRWRKEKSLDYIKKKFNFIKRFKYEKSDFLNTVEEGEWILLDGIENAPTFIEEKLSFLCGKKPELNLYEKNMKPISTTKGFHLFITYNSGRVLHNNPLSNSL